MLRATVKGIPSIKHQCLIEMFCTQMFIFDTYFLQLMTYIHFSLNISSKITFLSFKNSTYIVIMFLDYRFVEPCWFFELIFLHEKNMCHVEFPHIMFITEFYRLPKDFFHLRVVFHVPVYLGLLHQYRNVPVMYDHNVITIQYSENWFKTTALKDQPSMIYYFIGNLGLYFYTFIPLMKDYLSYKTNFCGLYGCLKWQVSLYIKPTHIAQVLATKFIWNFGISYQSN